MLNTHSFAYTALQNHTYAALQYHIYAALH